MAPISYRNAYVNIEKDVYEPAEDSFLLADVAIDRISDGMHVLEMGVGSGFVSAVVAANKNVEPIGCDINPDALECAYKNGIPVFRSNLFAGLRKKAYFDVILFNPPYLPTSEDEKLEGWLNYAFDGGVEGRDTIATFFAEVSDYLKPEGSVLLFISSLTGKGEVFDIMEQEMFTGYVVAETRSFFEKLMVIECKHNR
jgi:release factor glutamine methyltransferase